MATKFYCTLTVFLCITLTSLAQVLTRGPYLQVGTSTSMNIRWRTDLPAASKVRYGTSSTSLILEVSNATLTTEHELQLTGLSPKTQYWYTVETQTTLLQGNADNFFYTLPAPGSRSLIRVGVLGDCGNNSTNQMSVRNQLINYLGSNYMNAWLLLGDNAYSSGRDAQYQSNFFNIYRDKFLKQNPLYPSPGNHDYNTTDVSLAVRSGVPYHQVFSMPIHGEAGGVPSNNKAFYSFDIGNVHFLSLDSYGQEEGDSKMYDVNGTQATWVQQDLAANTNKEWIIAYWHHPPYSQGSRNSETETDMTAIRENFIRVLEENGVDLVLCGHSHVYERTRLIKGHYDYMSTFNAATHNLSSSSALYQDASSCPYIKNDATGQQGTVYVVAGSAGQLGGASLGYPHPAMYYSNNTRGGSLMLEIEGSRLDLKWINDDGLIRDHFTMMKNVGKNISYNIELGQSIELKASYVGSYEWSNAETQAAITVTPVTEGSSTYTVQDAYECVTDTFNVIATAALPVRWGSIKGWYQAVSKSNYLQWETLGESKNQYFSIERSENGIDFYEIGKTPAKTQSAARNTYGFIDNKPEGASIQYYYRVKQTDIDGAFTYSSIIKILKGQNLSALDIVLMPNPAKPQQAQIKSVGNYTGKVQVQVVNSVGKLIVRKNFVLNNTAQGFLPHVPSGTYFVTITAPDFRITKQLVIQ